MGTTELPRGALTQPHMQLDPPYSLFHSNPKYSPGPPGRRLKTRATEKALQAPFAHPKVPPEEGFSYKGTPQGSLYAAPHATGPSGFAVSEQH